ncbi:MAG: hypothetical protein APR62_07685 [Smithella sp. SDB]|nr:MAG: hypothetical protein APR62_07685 [Smithella sp. SDB]
MIYKLIPVGQTVAGITYIFDIIRLRQDNSTGKYYCTVFFYIQVSLIRLKIFTSPNSEGL